MSAQNKSDTPTFTSNASDWSDILFAFHVARLGTLTAAAEALDVHHSTVLRRINNFEKKLNTKLFHRHARGYTVTEAGKLMLKKAEQAQEQFDLLMGELQNADQSPKGTLAITTVSNMTALLAPLLHEFQEAYPQIRLEMIGDNRMLKLEHGEAHISLRPGQAPKEPDYIAQQTVSLAATLYASPAYIKRYGTLSSLAEITQHRFISDFGNHQNIPFMRWVYENISDENVYFRSNDFRDAQAAIKSGLGIGMLSCWSASLDPELVPLVAPRQDWMSDMWLLIHKDLRHSSKVQLFLAHIKASLQGQSKTIDGSTLRSKIKTHF